MLRFQRDREDDDEREPWDRDRDVDDRRVDLIGSTTDEPGGRSGDRGRGGREHRSGELDSMSVSFVSNSVWNADITMCSSLPYNRRNVTGYPLFRYTAVRVKGGRPDRER